MSIFRCLEKEENDLHLFGKGLFQVPEIYLAIQIGKQISFDKVFQNSTWNSEIKIGGSSGPVDIVFSESGSKNHLIEVKTCSTHPLYIQDVEKLMSISKFYVSIYTFISLLFEDCYSNEKLATFLAW